MSYVVCCTQMLFLPNAIAMRVPRVGNEETPSGMHRAFDFS